MLYQKKGRRMMIILGDPSGALFIMGILVLIAAVVVWIKDLFTKKAK